MAAARWWADDPTERYWMVQQAADPTDPLFAPKERFWGYSLLLEAAPGDVILHYSSPDAVILGSSRVASKAREGRVEWASHGKPGQKPYERDGWLLDTHEYSALDPVVRRSDLLAMRAAIASVYERIEARLGREFPLYGPFRVSGRDRQFLQQTYLSRFPRDVMRIFPSLAARMLSNPLSGDVKKAPFGKAGGSGVYMGPAYKIKPENVSVRPSDPWEHDPEKLERAHGAHSRTQNAFAQALLSRDIQPTDPGEATPEYDLAWEHGNCWYVVEVKSLTDTNEEKQLRLGLGQVLRYRHQVLASGKDARAVLVVERSPRDASWIELARSHGVTLTWPEMFDATIRHLCGT